MRRANKLGLSPAPDRPPAQPSAASLGPQPPLLHWNTVSRGKSRIPWLGAIASTAGLLFSIGAAAQSKPEKVVLPDGPGRDVVVKVCTNCHGAEKFRGHEGTDQHWQAVIDNMISKGATATDAEFDQIVAYLSKNFGYVPEASDLPPGQARNWLNGSARPATASAC